MKIIHCALTLIPLLLAGCATLPNAQAPGQSTAAEAPSSNALNERISYYARVYDVPESLIRRSIVRESGYNPAAHRGAFWG